MYEANGCCGCDYGSKSECRIALSICSYDCVVFVFIRISSLLSF